MSRKYHSGRRCPNCNREVDADTNADRMDVRPPDPGDLSVCLYCSHLNVFTENLGLRAATMEEAHAYLRDARVRRAVAATVEFQRRFGT